VLMPGGTEPFGFHQIEPVTWRVEQVYLLRLGKLLPFLGR
jgi:hypothetical protein